MLGVLLTQDGHEVHLAHDGPSGLQAVLTFRPEIGLLDLGLPGFDGCELARRIRALEDCKLIYLVALTGYGQPQDRLRSKGVERPTPNETYLPISFTVAEESATHSCLVGSYRPPRFSARRRTARARKS